MVTCIPRFKVQLKFILLIGLHDSPFSSALPHPALVMGGSQRSQPYTGGLGKVFARRPSKRLAK